MGAIFGGGIGGVSGLEPIGRVLVVLGAAILGLGILIALVGKIPFLGKLPGGCGHSQG